MYRQSNRKLCYKKPLKPREGFTLAEVLVTLAIIGIVAALTIPGLIISYQKKVGITAFKKMYSVINSAFSQYASNNDSTIYKDCSGNWAVCIVSTLNPYLTVAKSKTSYTTDPATEGCWAKKAYFYNGDDYNIINGTGMTCSILSDGAYIVFPNTNYFLVDVNGSKGPNKVGIDIYLIIYESNGQIYPGGHSKYVPWGWYGSDACALNQTGWGCAAKALLDQNY